MYPPSFQLCIFSVHTPARFPVGAPWRVGVGIRDSSVVLRNFDSYVPRTLSAAALDVFEDPAHPRTSVLCRWGCGAQTERSGRPALWSSGTKVGYVYAARSRHYVVRAKTEKPARTPLLTLIARKHRSTAYAFEPHNVAFEKPYHIPETIGSHRRLTSLTRS